MIAFFPEFYPDELLYSQLARYYIKSGYTAYCYAAEDLFVSPQSRPNIELLNEYTADALRRITQSLSMETIVKEHTMFPYYGRFLSKERRNKAFQAMVNMNGNYSNLLAIPKRKDKTIRYLRYCPMCADEDRTQYGETYWHRQHQIQEIKICPIHDCYLAESSLIISGRASPMLVTAEEVISNSTTIVMCHNQKEMQIAKYVAAIFQSDINIESNVLAGDFLHSRMGGTKYRSIRGEQRNMALLQADFNKFYKDLPNNWFTELWQIQKVLTNSKVNMFEICMMAMFLDVLVADLANMKLPERTQEQIFDEKVHMLHEQGLSYSQIATKLSANVSLVKAIGEGRYSIYHKPPRKPSKCGVKPRDWTQMDIDLLPKVREAIHQLQGDGMNRPKKVTIAAVEKMLNLCPKQIDNLKLCKAEIQHNYISQQEYWALEVVWAANTVICDCQPLNWRHIRDLTNMRKRNFLACLPYLSQYADDELCEKIKAL